MKHGQLTLDGAVDIAVTDTEALVRAITWQIQAFGGRVIDTRPHGLLCKFGDREYMIGVQEVGIWGIRQRAIRDVGIAAEGGSLSPLDGIGPANV